VKLRRRSAFREGAFADVSDLNPWLLPLRHMDPLEPHQGRIGFVTSEARHASRQLDLRRGIGEEFLVATRLHTHRPDLDVSALEYFSSVLGPIIARSGSETVDGVGQPLRLEDPDVLDLPLGTVLERRKSVREFSGDPIGGADLATILYVTAGITHKGLGVAIDNPDSRYGLHFRGVPSAGGLYAVDTYLVLLRGRGVPGGVYRYRPFDHALVRIVEDLAEEELFDAFIRPEIAGVNLSTVAAAIFFVGTPAKLNRKYGDRGVRYIFIEAGMMAFAANLAATALGWGVLDYQSYYEPRMERFLLLRPRQQYVLHAILLGWPFGWADDERTQGRG
jgi:SagB-type dehydrogenase family enzyme